MHIGAKLKTTMSDSNKTDSDQKEFDPRDRIILRKPIVRKSRMAEILEVSDRTLQTWTRRRIVPHIRIGQKVYYNVEKVLDHLEKYYEVTSRQGET